MIDTAHSLLAFGLLTAAAYGLGRSLLRGLAVGDEDSLSAAIWSLALGLLAAGLVLMSLGLVGWLSKPLIRVLTLLAGVSGIGEMLRRRWRLLNQRTDPPRTLRPSGAPTDEARTAPGWLTRGAVAVISVAALASLTSALAPPTAGDALCYHLELPKVFLGRGGFVNLPYHDNATFPLLAEMWYLWALALEGPVTAQLVHWGLGLLFAGATLLLARPILGPHWAPAAAALALLTPGVTNQMTAPLNDIALAAFTTLALVAWRQAQADDKNGRWLLLAGLAAGGALGVKYVALLFAAAVGVCGIWTCLRGAANSNNTSSPPRPSRCWRLACRALGISAPPGIEATPSFRFSTRRSVSGAPGPCPTARPP